MTARDRALVAFGDLGVGAPTFVARAPGRVNLIGEHTDYNGGFVLPVALPFDTVVVGTPRRDKRVEATSEGFADTAFLTSDSPRATSGWGRYVHGMGRLLADAGHATSGWTGALASDIPAGASLSSSAALELATGLAFLGPHTTLSPMDLAVVAQRVENEVMDLPSGIMDQLASAVSTAGAATLIDCRHLTTRAVAIPDGVAIVVMDTGTRRQLVDSEYAARRESCERVVAALGIAALRDATVADLEQLGDEHGIDRTRARHVITENHRVLQGVDALERGDLERFGGLMNESHRSLSHDYEVSGPALDHMVALAQHHRSCLGARMTGGGFAGGAVAVVPTADAADFIDHVASRYEAPPTQPAQAPAAFYVIRPGAGATIEPM